MLYYIVLFLVRKYLEDKPYVSFSFIFLIIMIWYSFEDKSSFFMYGECYFKWLFYFVFMLMGAYIGNGSVLLKYEFKKDILRFLFSLISFYTIFILGVKFNVKICNMLQPISLIPLMGIVVYMFKLCNVDSLKNLMKSKVGLFLRFISSLCLEVYLVQKVFLSDKYNDIFPINVILAFGGIFLLAYFTRCLGRILLQVFQNANMDWRKVFQFVE